jgi:hypothetical protein
LRICECDGWDRQAAAEIESGWSERHAAGGGPEIELIAASTASEALEEITGDVNREAAVLGRVK